MVVKYVILKSRHKPWLEMGSPSHPIPSPPFSTPATVVMEEKMITINDFMYELEPHELYKVLEITQEDWVVFMEDFCEAASSSTRLHEFLERCGKFPTVLLAMLLAQFFAGRGYLILRDVYPDVWILLMSCWIEKVEKSLEEEGDGIIDPLFYFEDLQYFPKPLLILFLWFVCAAIEKHVRSNEQKHERKVYRRNRSR